MIDGGGHDGFELDRGQSSEGCLAASAVAWAMDAAIIAASSDGVLVMTRFGSTKREQLAHAIKSLEDVGAPVLGSVFTMTPARGASSYSYNYGYYGEGEAGKPEVSTTSPVSGRRRADRRKQEVSGSE